MLNFHFFLFNSLIEVEISKSSRSQKETQRRRLRIFQKYKRSGKAAETDQDLSPDSKRGQDNR